MDRGSVVHEFYGVATHFRMCWRNSVRCLRNRILNSCIPPCFTSVHHDEKSCASRLPATIVLFIFVTKMSIDSPMSCVNNETDVSFQTKDCATSNTQKMFCYPGEKPTELSVFLVCLGDGVHPSRMSFALPKCKCIGPARSPASLFEKGTTG